MFHTFEAQGPGDHDDDGGSTSVKRRRRVKTRACQSCRRRKTYCDGDVPCGTCKWYRKTAQCSFMAEPSQPLEVPTKRRSAAHNNEFKTVVQRLFPRQSIDELANLSREQLIQRITIHEADASAQSEDRDEDQEQDQESQEDTRGLEQLQDFPESGTAAPSRPQSPSPPNGVTDDINALALSVKRARSYLGVSSVVAVLRIILLLDPDSKAFTSSAHAGGNPRVAHNLDASEGLKVNQFSPSVSTIPEASRQPTMWDEVPAINAFFTYVHPQIPLLEEEDFRESYMGGKRGDPRWKLLLNSVLAMGSVAASTAEDQKHLVFYERARQHLDLGLFTSVHIETVQALTILGGMYLHYIQQPNLANFLVGATFRMATTLGLHRDYFESGSASKRSADFPRMAELRRRTWWSLCCLDACNANFLGRPTLGRLGPGHTAKKPESPVNNNAAITTLLQDTIDYCVISTRMDDYLADQSVLGQSTRQELDDAFLAWLNRASLHSLKASPDTPAGVAVAMNVMRWRCQSARIFIYRPILLWYAMRCEPMERISSSKREAILACRQRAAQLIEDISATWRMPSPCVMAGWPATWLIYQTSMVPMLSLFCDSDCPDVVAACQQQVELVISTLSDLEHWSCTARRSLEVVTRLYSASQAYQARMQEQQMTVSSVLPPHDLTEEAMGTLKHHSEGLPEGQAKGTPATHLSGSTGEEFLLGDFFDDLSWMDNHDHTVHGVGNDLAFLDYYDI